MGKVFSVIIVNRLSKTKSFMFHLKKCAYKSNKSMSNMRVYDSTFMGELSL